MDDINIFRIILQLPLFSQINYQQNFDDYIVKLLIKYAIDRNFSTSFAFYILKYRCLLVLYYISLY